MNPDLAPYRTLVLEGCDGAGKSTLAAHLADQHGFTVVHSPRTPDSLDLIARYRERLREPADTARAARPDVRLAAFIHVVVDDDTDRARTEAAHGIATFARSSRHRTADPAPGCLDFFAVLGPAAYCRDRILALVDVGLERLHIVTGCSWEYRKRSYRAFMRHVAPALREHRRR
ncbi:hypothetical protein [Streptomyces sp. NPDC005898]|uniref:hypothetical protein n=1 Tax=Streptomyces sp. NPDC005898 TaxID=3157082 RepID=UPI0033EA4EF7